MIYLLDSINNVISKNEFDLGTDTYLGLSMAQTIINYYQGIAETIRICSAYDGLTEAEMTAGEVTHLTLQQNRRIAVEYSITGDGAMINVSISLTFLGYLIDNHQDSKFIYIYLDV